ncbi:DEAD/DEAH box helicase family protein [Phenylobacterium sp.]|uniref:DEAD/DEAH box helicase n=1 Tax=Phenylobacterium sp. TaxID=1871053 RepID=UPI00301DDC2F
MKTPRPHQKAANDATIDFVTQKTGNPMVVIPVGGGKSFVMADFIMRIRAIYAEARFVMLAHMSELLKQNAGELFGLWPDADVSFYSDKLGQKRLDGQVVFASIQSIYKRAFEIRGIVDFVLIDECHLLSPNENTMYRQFLSELRMNSPCVRVVGYTGTPFRPGSGYLHRGENALFTDIAYEVPMNLLIDQGYLCPLVTPRMRTQMDTTGVKRQGGDFIGSQLAKAVDKEEVTRACVDEIVEHGAVRKKWLVFAADVQHAEHIRDEIRARGYTCEAVHSKLPVERQNAILRAYEGDGLRCLVNVAQLTTGFNNPAIDLLAFMRPTRSPVLYIQCCGRAMRTFPGKRDAVVLDFGGVVEALGPIDQIAVSQPKKRGKSDDRTVPVKICPSCQAESSTAARVCIACGHEYPAPAHNLSGEASDAAILSSQIKPKSVPVTRVFYALHQKDGKLPTMRVNYQCGLKTYREWVCFSHSGSRRQDAANWWQVRAPGIRTPNSVEEALKLAPSLPVPSEILIKKGGGGYWEVVECVFEPIAQAG